MTLKKLCSAMTLVLAMNAGVSRAEDLTTLPWLVSAADVAGRPWSSSLLVFTEQVPDGEGFLLSGYFDWYLSGTSQGRELVRGTMDASGRIDLAGYELINPGEIILDVYRARLAAGGHALVNGTFGVPQGVAGVWSAKQTLALTIALTAPDKVELCWGTGTNFWYQLQAKADLALGDWAPVGTGWRQGAGEVECAELTIPAESPQQFYQVVLTNQPPAL